MLPNFWHNGEEYILLQSRSRSILFAQVVAIFRVILVMMLENRTDLNYFPYYGLENLNAAVISSLRNKTVFAFCVILFYMLYSADGGD